MKRWLYSFLLSLIFCSWTLSCAFADTRINNFTVDTNPSIGDELLGVKNPLSTALTRLWTIASLRTIMLQGNATTATALSANGSNCNAGYYPLGVDASGNAESCTQASSGGGGSTTQVGDCTASVCFTGAATGGTYLRIYDGNSAYGSLITSDLTGNRTYTFPNFDGTMATVAGTETLTNKTLTAANNSIGADTAVALAANGANCSSGQLELGVDASGAAEGCTASVNISTSLTDPLIIGGTAASSILNLESTSGAGTSDSIKFLTGSQSERMRITTAGKIGIGTTVPANIVSVVGGVSIGSAAYAGTTAPSNGLLVTGNVGIGSTSPQGALDVVGSGYISGNLNMGTVGIGTINIGSAGVTLVDDGDGSLTFTGAGNGSDEDLNLNFDDTANTIVASSSTGVTSITLTGMGITSTINDMGWSIQSGANTACTTTCTSACIMGFDATAGIVSCSNAAADQCLCAGGS